MLGWLWKVWIIWCSWGPSERLWGPFISPDGESAAHESASREYKMRHNFHTHVHCLASMSASKTTFFKISDKKVSSIALILHLYERSHRNSNAYPCLNNHKNKDISTENESSMGDFIFSIKYYLYGKIILRKLWNLGNSEIEQDNT